MQLIKVTPVNVQVQSWLTIPSSTFYEESRASAQETFDLIQTTFKQVDPTGTCFLTKN